MMAGLDGRPTWRSSTVALPLLLLLLWLGVHEGCVQHTSAFGFPSRWFGRSNRQRAAPPVVSEPPMEEGPVWLVMRVERRRFYHLLPFLRRPKFDFDYTFLVEQYRVLRMTCYALKSSARVSNHAARLGRVSSCYDEAVKYARQNGSPSVPFVTYEVAERNVPQLLDLSLREKIAAAGEGTTDANVDTAAELGELRVGDGAIFVRCQKKSPLDPGTWNCLGTKDGVPFQPVLADQYQEDFPSLPLDADDEEPHLPRSSASDLTFQVDRRVKTTGAASLHGYPTADARILRPFLRSTAETSRKTRVVVVKLREPWKIGNHRNGFPIYRKTVTKKRLPKGGTHVTLECFVGVNMFAIPSCFGCLWREAVQRVFPQKSDNREKTRIFITSQNPENMTAFMRVHHNPKYNYVFEGKWSDDLVAGSETAPDAVRQFLRAPLAASLWSTYTVVDARHTDVLFFQRDRNGHEIQVARATCATLFTAIFNSTWWELKKYMPPQSIEAWAEYEDPERRAAAEPLDEGVVRLDVSLTGSEITTPSRSSNKLNNLLTFHVKMKEAAEREYQGKCKNIQPTMSGCSSDFGDNIAPMLAGREIIHIKVIRGEPIPFRNTEIYAQP